MDSSEVARSSELGKEDFAATVGSSDPAVGIRAVASLKRLAEQLESLHVDRARDLGWSWSQIAAELGVSKQAVHQKHGGRGGSSNGAVGGEKSKEA